MYLGVIDKFGNLLTDFGNSQACGIFILSGSRIEYGVACMVNKPLLYAEIVNSNVILTRRIRMRIAPLVRIGIYCTFFNIEIELRLCKLIGITVVG